MDTPFLYLLDVLFSVCIMHALTVLVWISLMTLCDHLIFPHDRWLSLVVSLGTGCGLSLVVFALMLPHRAAHRHLKVSNRPAAYVFGATFNVLTILAVLMLWRGLWGLIQELVTSGPTRVEADWICHALGFLGMVCLQVRARESGIDIARWLQRRKSVYNFGGTDLEKFGGSAR